MGLSASLHAQTLALAQESSAAALPSVTVHSNGPESATVLDGVWWQQVRQSTLGESLGAELGVQSSAFGAGASRPVVRGLDGVRVPVLAGGTPVRDLSSMGPDHAVAVDPLLAQQVRIVRGPAALLQGSALGGMVEVDDGAVPSQRPEQAVQGQAHLQWGSAARERSTAAALTTGHGPWALRVGVADRQAQAYRAGAGWMGHAFNEHGARTVQASQAQGQTGSIGLAWIDGGHYVGAAYSQQRSHYGLPGHAHSDCHVHSDHLHCHDHAHHSHHGHAPHEEEEHAPVVAMVSHRWDVRGQWEQPFAGVQALRLHAAHTRYGHEEQEGGVPLTTFRSRAHDVQVQMQHLPVVGWSGTVSLQHGRLHWGAWGQEAYVTPSTTQSWSVASLQERTFGAVHWQVALRHEQQSVTAPQQAWRAQHQGNSASVAARWQLQPGWQAVASWGRAVRAPAAQELLADGMHVATNTYEIGNRNLRNEVSHLLELGVRKHSGATTLSAQLYRNRIHGYIYGHTLDEDAGVLLQRTAQADAVLTGAEAQLRQRLNRWMGMTVFGDVVHARFKEGGALPRIPAARWGLRWDASWQSWEGQAEWVQVSAQRRTAAFESPTPGYGMLNVQLRYQRAGSPWAFSLRAQNLTNRLAWAHTSAVKAAAPLKGRNITLGMHLDF